ncbi:GNAT family N-acetyltransferase [Chloroflexota bacterium]
MSYNITQESFESLASYRDNPEYGLEWSSVFVLPVWLKVWWQEFKPEEELFLGAVRNNEKVIGIAPLMVKEDRASLIGSTDVCDYLDFVVVPGSEKEFFNFLLDDLKQKGISQLDLKSLRPDSTVLTWLVDIARNRGYEVTSQPEDVTVELDLPSTWEEYLEILTKKQRHEVRRKLRRLPEAGKAEFRVVEDRAGIENVMDTFLRMFIESRSDKASYMTDQKESFFRALADTLTESRLLRLGILELDTIPTAMIMYFNYNDCIYLYNSGYEPKYDSLSVGLLSKVLSIRESIQEGKKKYDFLKGNEAYKYHLGGKEITLSNCQITIK